MVKKSANQAASSGDEVMADSKQASSPVRGLPAQPAQPAQVLKQGLIIRIAEPTVRHDVARRETESKFVAPRLDVEEIKQLIRQMYAAGAEWVTINDVPVKEEDLDNWHSNSVTVKGLTISPPFQLAISGDPNRLRQSIAQKESAFVRLQQDSKVEMSVQFHK